MGDELQRKRGSLNHILVYIRFRLHTANIEKNVFYLAYSGGYGEEYQVCISYFPNSIRGGDCPWSAEDFCLEQSNIGQPRVRSNLNQSTLIFKENVSSSHCYKAEQGLRIQTRPSAGVFRVVS